jgi:hypothetical protein
MRQNRRGKWKKTGMTSVFGLKYPERVLLGNLDFTLF